MIFTHVRATKTAYCCRFGSLFIILWQADIILRTHNILSANVCNKSQLKATTNRLSWDGDQGKYFTCKRYYYHIYIIIFIFVLSYLFRVDNRCTVNTIASPKVVLCGFCMCFPCMHRYSLGISFSSLTSKMCRLRLIGAAGLCRTGAVIDSSTPLTHHWLTK